MSSAKSFHETFYGTPTEDETRRRRGKKRHNKAAKEEPQNEVAVIGVHYRSFDDDSLAAFVNSATALVPWNGDPKLLIDRYDVRHLLQDLTGIRRRRARPPSPDATKEELDYERYRDVEGLENPSPPEGMSFSLLCVLPDLLLRWYSWMLRWCQVNPVVPVCPSRRMLTLGAVVPSFDLEFWKMPFSKTFVVRVYSRTTIIKLLLDGSEL